MRFPRRLPLTLVLAAAILPAFAQSGAPAPAAKPRSAAGKQTAASPVTRTP